MIVQSLSNPINWAFTLIKHWSESQQYGRIIISLENGKIVNVKTEQNLKPPKGDE